MKKVVSFLLLLLFPFVLFAEKNGSNVQAEIVTDVQQISPGSKLRVLLKFEINEGWHIYGEKPGMYGLPTKLDITLGEYKAAPHLSKKMWPKPEIFQSEDGESFGYTGEFPVYVGGFEVPSTAPVGEDLPLKLEARWLECSKDVCIPKRVEKQVMIPVVAEGASLPLNKEYRAAYRMITLSEPSDL